MEVVCLKSKFLRNVFDQNTYVLKNENSAIVIDAGAEIEDVKNALGNAKVEAILMTHLHFDHFWNLEKYLQEFGCDVCVCAGAEEKFEKPELNCSTIMKVQKTQNVDKKYIKYYQNLLKIKNFDVEVIFTPGHSSDCVCLKIENNLFCGDTLFKDGVGRTDLVDSDPVALKESLNKIAGLDFDTAYSGHYESFSKERALDVISYYL